MSVLSVAAVAAATSAADLPCFHMGWRESRVSLDRIQMFFIHGESVQRVASPTLLEAKASHYWKTNTFPCQEVHAYLAGCTGPAKSVFSVTLHLERGQNMQLLRPQRVNSYSP